MLQVRAGLAYAICLSAFFYLCTGRKLIFILGVLVAALIHKSAIIFMVVPLWIFIVDRLGLLITLFITLIAGLSLSYLIPVYAPFVLGSIASKTYVLSQSSDFVGSVGILNPTLIKYIFLGFASYVYIDVRESKEWSMVFSVYILAAISLISLSNYYVLGSRVASLFAVVEPLIIAKIISLWAASQRNLAVRFIVIFFGITSSLILLSLNVDVKNVVNNYELSTE
jgi:hypothetical protein